jgi:hypothetical protein
VSEILVNIGTAITGLLAWFNAVLSAIETAVEGSWMLQIGLGIGAGFVGFQVLKKVIDVVRGFLRK